MKDFKFTFLPKLALVLFCVISLAYILILGHSLLAPMFFSFLMALLMLPLANYLENKLKFKRGLATLTSVIIMIVVIGAIVTFFVNQLSALAKDWPLLEKNANESFHELQNYVAKHFGLNSQKQLDYIHKNTEKAVETSATLLTATLAGLSSSLLFFGFTLLFTFFILNYRTILYTFLINVFKEEHKEKVTTIISQVQKIIKKYILGLFIQMFIVTLLMVGILSILGIKYAVLLGLTAGIFNIIPYIGIFSALVISCLITFATAGAGKALIVLLVYIGVHAVDGNVLLPLVVGSKVKINALISFIGIIVGEMLWGISGMFLCIPMLAITKIIFDNIDDLKPWGYLMGEGNKPVKKRRTYRLTKKIQLEEQE